MSNKAIISFKLTNTNTNTVSSELSSPVDKLEFLKALNLLNGVGAGKAEAIYHDQRTLGASANEELDLNAVLTNVYGTTLTFTKIKAVVVFAAVGNTNNVVVGGAAANAFLMFSDGTDKVPIKPGGMIFLYDPTADGMTVTPATGDLLKIENSAGGTPVTYDIIIIGETT